MSAHEAEDYHHTQTKVFEASTTDLVSALTMNYVEEAVGIANAAKSLNMQVVISFTLETDGRLPTGQTLQAAIEATDAATESAPAYYMINCADPDFALEASTLVVVPDRCDRGLLIQFAAIVAKLVASSWMPLLKAQSRVAHRLIRLGVGALHLPAQRAGLDILPGAEQAAHFGQHRSGSGVVAVFGSARPERVFVELQPFVDVAAKDHGTQTTIAHRQRLLPLFGWLGIPQPHFICRYV